MDIANVKAIVRRALEDKVLTRAEQQEIAAAILADGHVTPEEQEVLQLILEKIRTGKIESAD